MAKRYYLAYGSNLNVGQMQYRCPQARLVGTAWLEDYELLFKGSKTGSYLTVESKEGSQVPLGVWEVSPTDELRLDRYEGYPHFYYKKELKIKYQGLYSKQMRERDAFIYIMHEERPLGIPSTAYFRTCCEGYDNFNFDIQFLIDAYNASSKEDEYENDCE